MLTYGFFNSVSGDRTYDAETFNTFFEGLISKNGVFDNVGDCFAVSANGMGVNVGTGKAIVNNHWAKNTAVKTLAIADANDVLSRYDMVTLRWHASNRNITLEVTTGTAASTPTKPVPKRNTAGTYEIVLAYVYVPANATSLTNANIENTRHNADLCGIITGLIKQVNVTDLYKQYDAAAKAKVDDLDAYTEAATEKVAELDAYKENAKTDFDAWFASIVNTLVSNMPLQRNDVHFTTTREDGTQYIDLPSELNYVDGDVLDVFVDGVLLIPGVQYEIMTNEVENVPMFHSYSDIPANSIVTFHCLKIIVTN